MAEVFWSRMTASEINEMAAQGAIAILPVASMEQHGPHMAVGVDTVLCTEVCRRIAVEVQRARPAIVAPTVWMGLAEHHVAFGGTFTMSLATWQAILEDCCRSIERAGFGDILIVNGHGGNASALNALTESLTAKCKARIATTTYWALPESVGAYADILEAQKGVRHACEAETSMMLAVARDHVREHRIAEAVGDAVVASGTLNRPINVWRSFRDITETGVMGDPRPASAAKGEKLLDVTARLIADKIVSNSIWS